MKEVPACSKELSEMVDLENKDEQETLTDSKTPQNSGRKPSSQNPSKIKAFLRRNAFIVLTLASVVLGVGLGFALRSSNMTARDIKYFSFPGELLIRMLQMLVLPLIVSSLVTGMSSLDSRTSGKIGLRAISYYIGTTLIAVFTGIVLVVLIQPGKSSRDASVSSAGNVEAPPTLDSFLDLIRNMFPSNLVKACFQQYKTVYSKSDSVAKRLGVGTDTNEVTASPNATNGTLKDDMVPMPGSSEGVNILGLVVFSCSFGLALGRMEAQGKPLRDFFDCLNEVIMRMVKIIIWYSPVGIIFLIAGQIVAMRAIWEVSRQLAMYILCVFAGLIIHSLVTLPLFYVIVMRKNPYRFMAGLIQALVTAFGTSSSSATLPVTFRCLEENHNMDKRVTRFMLPIGATISMDGTALYEAVAAIFIAQFNDMDLNLGQIIIISITATAASIGAAGIPQAGLVTVVIVLTSVGLPTEDMALIIAVDWMM
uniref:excitatory amino acid transporter 1-like n=1 Tax=Centroberyx gerrardi TaxID=166262 RepID=UPI003AAEB4C4